ncbi:MULTISPECIES: hypothetical protein [unclassified Streptomyces]|uniref:hypothetical protein n=1 Tax=unclassified Streptomyces TaxID=2593676 RepID=UPI0004BF989D|nr:MULTISPECIES: hypothetical protein [unclassified Streptomyces]
MKPHAEIAEVWPRDGHIRLTGRLHGPTATGTGTGSWELLVVRRSRPEQRLRYPVRLTGDRFEAGLPIADLVTEDPAALEEWDLHLTDGTAELRAGRRLDDIRGKKKIMVFPEQRIEGLSVRPYYTVKDNLSLECRTAGNGAAV